MKSKMLTRILGAFAAFSMAAGVGVAIGGATTKEAVQVNAAESLAYTLEPAEGTSNSYAGNCDVTIAGVTWNVNGNAQMIPWRLGGKSITNTDRTLYSKTAISEDITKITVTHGAASSITINSWTLIVSTAANGGGTVKSNLTLTFSANDTTTIQRPSGVSWAGCFYKFTYNVTVSGSSNKFLQFSGASFYYEASSSEKFSVTYNGNGNDSGSVPTDSSSYDSGATVTVLGNTGNLAKTNNEFAGWNTSASGTGSSYSAGDTFVIDSNVTLYAQWTYSKHYTDDTSAKTITWDLTNPEYISASDTQMSWSSPKATMVVDKADSSLGANHYCPPAYSSTRFYTNSVLTIAPVSGYQINQITFISTSENYASALADSTWTNAVASATTTTVTVTPSSKKSSVSAIIGANTGNTTVTVSYAIASDVPTVTLDKTSINLLTSDSSGVVVTAAVDNVASPTYVWSTENTNILLENERTNAVTIKPNSTTAGSASVHLVVGGVNPNLTADVSVTISTPAPGQTPETAYTVSQAISAIDSGEGVNDVYATGIVSQIVTAYNAQYGNITYNISADGLTSSTQLQAYRGKSYNGANFTSENDIQVGDIVIIYGDLTKYGTTYEFAADNQLVDLKREVTSITAVEGNLIAFSGDASWDLSTLVVKGTVGGKTTAEDITEFVSIETSDIPGTVEETVTRTVTVVVSPLSTESELQPVEFQVSGTIKQSITSGRYYIMNSDKTLGLNAVASASSSPSQVTLSSANNLTPFDVTVVEGGLYEISVTIETVKYYLVCNTTATSSSNDKLRVTDSPNSSLKSIYWTLDDEGVSTDGAYHVYQNTTGSSNRYLSCYTNGSDWRAYLNTNSGDPEIQFVKEGFYANAVAQSILDLACNNGATRPSTSAWADIESSFEALTIANEISIMKNSSFSTTIANALAKYDYIVGKYGSDVFSDFLEREPAPITQGRIINLAESSEDKTMIGVIGALTIATIAAFSVITIKKRKSI